MPYGHKHYQIETLDALREYLRRTVATQDADIAFYQQTRRAYCDIGSKLDIPSLRGLPYVCLRLPTGGGKTVVACRAIAVAVEEYLRREKPLVLWLAPSDAIVGQTLRALKDRAHPYRQTLESELGQAIEAIGLEEAHALTRATLDGHTTIVVATVQSLRVEGGKKENRKIYEPSGALMPHFDALTPQQQALPLDRYPNGRPIESLANALAVRTPLIIADEAHNLRTRLTFTSLARFCPSLILEWTATPAKDEFSPNVLHHVSAAELKAEGMIKMPIELRTDPDWKNALRDAKTRRDELEKSAALLDGEYVRPIVLLQAQKKGEPVTWDVLEAALRDELKIPANQIAVETGDRSDLEGVNIADRACPVRYVITVDKLREGWDCPFAYVLYSARNLSSKTAVEQILGRVLRMPAATRKPENLDELNHAYAFITSHKFGDAVKALKDSLVASGFEEFDAQHAIIPLQSTLFPTPESGLFAPQPGAAPAKSSQPFEVPQLALQLEDGSWEPFDADEVLEADWHLLDFPATLHEAEFPSHVERERVELDIADRGKLKVALARDYVSIVQDAQLSLLPDDIQDAAQLAVWLDRQIAHRDLDGPQVQTWLLKLLTFLVEERHIPLDQLARERLRLKSAAEAKIKVCRQQAESTALQKLFADESKIAVCDECRFIFDPHVYPVGARYEGIRRFDKHFYDEVGALNGEEEMCAWYLNSLPNVVRWVRNLEKKPDAAFWLQTEANRFYPDFVAELSDGRVAVIEYKGGDRLSNDDTKRKTRVGSLWQARSNGRGVFLMVGAEDYQSRLKVL
ncbi:MAG: type restriction enzyme [Abditibacteriota bacterium]|nr:type restriction enzyme [Abditibacteriota bacterium]